MMPDFDDVWREIMEDGAFSESAVIAPASGASFPCKGIFYSGTYDTSSKTPYSGEVFESRDFFQLSSLSVPSSVSSPWNSLKGATISLPDRGVFKVHDVKGKLGGMLTLRLKEVAGNGR
jgi:hypothetical protein